MLNKKEQKAAKWVDNYECNLALGFVLDILKDKGVNLKTLIDKSKKFGIPLSEMEIESPSKKLRKTFISTAKSFRKQKPELIVILSYAFKAVLVEHLKQKL